MMTSEEVIRNLADTLQEAHSEALRALREIRSQHDGNCVEIDAIKPAKLDRNRLEGCEYCNDFGKKRPNFCYCCGKPQTEEAWAELERRINLES